MLTTILCATGAIAIAATTSGAPDPAVEKLKAELVGGKWVSLAVELRPQEDRTGTGKVLPFYIKRVFQYLPGDRFVGEITSFADAGGKAPLVRFEFRGHVRWQGPHPVAKGAQKIDYILDEAFNVTPLNEGFAAMLNQASVPGLDPWKVGTTQNIVRKAFPPFKIAEGEILSDYDLIWVHDGMLFMGAKHVDGTPFDKPERRPDLLQIPLVRAKE